MEYRQNNATQQQPQGSRQNHQRFSWQMPPQEEAPAYEEVQHQQYHQRVPHTPQQPHVSTNVNDQQNRHFSYAQTPVEHEAFIYMSTPNDPPLPQAAPQTVQHVQSPYTPIDSRPQSTFNPLTSAPQPQSPAGYVAPSSYPDNNEKAPVSPISPTQSGPRALPFSPVSPIPPPQHFSQQVQQPPAVTIPQTSHARKMSNLSPINTNVRAMQLPPIPPTPPSGTHQTSPLPHKTPITPISPTSATKDSRGGENRRSHAINEPYSPHGFGANQTQNFHAVFSPDAAHGPNGLDFALHQPGQISHPNMESKSSKAWKSSLCACGPDVGTCLTGLFCPCIIYGRTSYRLSQKSSKKDPTDMLGHSSVNGHCLLMTVACGLGALFPALQRTRIRRAYKIDGGVGGDLLRGCCCCCCTVVQNEREVKGREEESRRWAGPVSGDVYGRVGGMVYKPQQ